jgi:hypothetical protein
MCDGGGTLYRKRENRESATCLGKMRVELVKTMNHYALSAISTNPVSSVIRTHEYYGGNVVLTKRLLVQIPGDVMCVVLELGIYPGLPIQLLVDYTKYIHT